MAAEHEYKLRRLVKMGGDGLVILEPDVLGAVGTRADSGLLNLGTMRDIEVLVGLRRGGILNDLMRGSPDRVVWELGGRGGGLAYRIRKLCPGSTYVVLDEPEAFLLSATYLMNRFPEAWFRFLDGESRPAASADGEGGFLFAPTWKCHDERLPEPDVVLTVGSLSELPSEHVESAIGRAHETGCRLVYSLNRGGPGDFCVGDAREIVDHYYWPHEIPVLPVGFTEPLPRLGHRATIDRNADRHRHVVGWRRLAT